MERWKISDLTLHLDNVSPLRKAWDQVCYWDTPEDRYSNNNFQLIPEVK